MSTFIIRGGVSLLISGQMDPTTLSTLVAARLLEQYQLDLWLVPSLRNITEKLLFREGVGGRVVELFVSTWDNKRTIYLSAIKFRAATAQSF